MGNDQPKSLLAIPAWRRPIKVGFDLMAGKTRKFLQLAQELPDLMVSTRASGQAEAVLLFVNSLAETEKLTSKAGKLVKPEGMLWIAYAKGSSKVKTDVNRDKLWAAVQPIGWQPIRQIALDEVWSAMRFKPVEK